MLDDVPTGVTPKKKTWNVPQSWERTEPREALLEAFRRRKVDSDEMETETTSIPSSPEDLPTVASVESIPSVASLPVSKMRKPTGKMDKLDLSGGGVKEERVVVPLGEALGNIPVPRRVRR